MNRNDQNTSNDTLAKNAASNPRTAQASNDDGSGTSASSREAQQGSGSDMKSQQNAPRSDARTDGGASR